MIILIGVFMVNSAKKEAAYQSALSSPTGAGTQEIPLKFIGVPGNGSTQHLRISEVSDNSQFIIDEESEMEK